MFSFAFLMHIQSTMLFIYTDKTNWLVSLKGNFCLCYLNIIMTCTYKQFKNQCAGILRELFDKIVGVKYAIIHLALQSIACTFILVHIFVA